MASVSSLDQDMRNLRLGRYTPQAAKEVRVWVEDTLKEPLASGDLLESLRDGVALCKLANLVLPSPGVKYKASPMPFIQMENISHFLKACEMEPLHLPAHDRFLTVDLYEAKDPAQVLQCLGAFSRRAHAVKPTVFRAAIGPKKAGGMMSPTSTGGATPTTTNGSGAASWRGGTYGRPASPTKPSAAVQSSQRAMSPSLTGGSTGSQGSASKSPGPVSSWSSKKDEGATSPAWNIHQYGYMGGASQGNQGISFGARRQITSQAPSVPSLAEKERRRKEKAEENERLRQQAEDAEHRRHVEREAEEERETAEEERRWEEETRRLRDEEKRRVEEQKRQWEEQERKWKEEEDARRKEQEAMQATLAPKRPPEKPRVSSSDVLRGQTLSQYQREQAALLNGIDGSTEVTPEQRRVHELEKQLEEARERERKYQAEREERMKGARESEAAFTVDEKEYLKQAWQRSKDGTTAKPAAAQPHTHRPLPSQPKEPPTLPSRPLQEPSAQELEQEQSPTLPSRPQGLQQSDSASSIPRLGNPESGPTSSPLGSANRPLPTPEKDREYAAYSPEHQRSNRTDQYLNSHPPPTQPFPRISASQEAGDASLEQHHLRDARLQSPAKTKAGGWASKSLLEREMERERERQREWEKDQQSVKNAPKDPHAGTGEGGSWDVNQYGFVGGDSQNKGSSVGSGINIGGRRQILGPRPQK